jgi:hypothetical protein
MAIKGLLSAAAVSAALLGCATTAAPPGARVNCDTGSGACDVPIHVGGNCSITAPDVDVFGEKNIFWVIDQDSVQAGYKFPDSAVHLGVWIKDPPRGQFDSPDRQNDRRFKLHDKNAADGKGSFRYGVQVVNGSTTCTLDPFIVNH